MDRICPVIVEARGPKYALYNSDENITELKWESKFLGMLQIIKSSPAHVS